MARPKRDARKVSLLLDTELFEELEEYCEKTYLTKTAAIQKALSAMFEAEKITEKRNASETGED